MAGVPYEKMPEFDLLEARFDQSPAGPRDDARAYVICSTPRSGSWLLCRQLINAGLGVPSEYFNVLHAAPLCARWRVDARDTRAYLNKLRAMRTTPNRVWGTKLLWTQFAERRSALKVELLGDSRLVYLYRDDIATQAVSLHLSCLTGVWDFDGTVSTYPRTDLAWGDHAHLAECDRTIRRQNTSWHELFASRRSEPLVVRYEDFIADQPGTLVRIAEALGLAPSEYCLPPPEPRDSAFPPEIEMRRKSLVAEWRSRRAA